MCHHNSNELNISRSTIQIEARTTSANSYFKDTESCFSFWVINETKRKKNDCDGSSDTWCLSLFVFKRAIEQYNGSVVRHPFWIYDTNIRKSKLINELKPILAMSCPQWHCYIYWYLLYLFIYNICRDHLFKFNHSILFMHLQ